MLVRDRQLLRDTFRIMPDYLRDAHRLEEVHLCDYGVQLTRSFRALKLWMSFKVFGAAAFRQAVTRGFHLAASPDRRLRRRLLGDREPRANGDRGLPLSRAGPRRELGINRRLVGDMIADGYAMLSSTTLHGATALRLCTINPRTTEDEIAETVRRLGAGSARTLEPGGVPVRTRSGAVTGTACTLSAAPGESLS